VSAQDSSETVNIDDIPLRFGKHKGQTPNQIAEHDPSYVTWMRANVFPSVCSRELAQDCEDAIRDNDGEIFEDRDFGDWGDQ
jgi:hypothetical protein